ncbi:helix-hairpin-helix domain-containing protein [Streptomyces sp. NPDC057499]|uniref:helix-hairpin-helix domain-containing protein n=1 Tax=Streptomyces sp. NPDC057499 TaxID=3346150 RepID=UPI0036A2214A
MPGSADALAAASRRRADALLAGAYGRRPTQPVRGPDPGTAADPGGAGPVVIARAPAAVSAPVSVPDTGSGAAPGAVPGAAPPGRWERLVPALRERMPVWVRLRCGLEPRALAALAVVLVAAGVFAAVHFWSARPHSVHAPDPVTEAARVRTPSPAGGGPGVAEPPDGPAPAAGQGGHVVVDVSGKVRRPGVRRLPSGARVTDALRAAGGVREGADLTGLNRARVLVDGEQIVVGAPPGTTALGGVGGGGSPPAGPVGLNTATAEQLETLPGVGPVLAQHIVEYRAQHGGFRSVDELREVNGIGDRRFSDLRPLVGP